MKTGLIVEDSTMAEAREKLSQLIPDIALVDIGLPDGNGIDLIEKLNNDSQPTVCVITSVFDDDKYIFSALRAGASGYLLKDQKKESLIDMLKGIVSGEPPLSPAVARRVLGYFSTSSAVEKTPEVNDRISEKNSEVVSLTNRESEVLALISKGYTTASVSDLLSISNNTVAGYVKSIYRKLNISSRAEATLEAARRGMISPSMH